MYIQETLYRKPSVVNLGELGTSQSGSDLSEIFRLLYCNISDISKLILMFIFIYFWWYFIWIYGIISYMILITEVPEVIGVTCFKYFSYFGNIITTSTHRDSISYHIFIPIDGSSGYCPSFITFTG